MAESAREVLGLVKVRRKSPKGMWWNGEVEAAVERKAACKEIYREEKRKVKRCIYHRKKR